jgi:hypothetical protein
VSTPSSYIDEIAQAIRAATPPGLLPDETDLDALFRLYAVLALGKGGAVTARDVHNAWSAWMLNRGRSHDALAPFDALAPDVQAKDEPFAEAIRRVVRDR